MLPLPDSECWNLGGFFNSLSQIHECTHLNALSSHLCTKTDICIMSFLLFPLLSHSVMQCSPTCMQTCMKMYSYRILLLFNVMKSEKLTLKNLVTHIFMLLWVSVGCILTWAIQGSSTGAIDPHNLSNLWSPSQTLCTPTCLSLYSQLRPVLCHPVLELLSI